MPALRRTFVTASIVWAVLLPIAPFAASQPAPAPFWYALAFVVYGAGTIVCHQLPARSFHAWSAQWPVCARCAGIYFGAALTVGMVVVSGMTRIRMVSGWSITTSRARVLLTGAVLPTAVTLVYEWTTGDTPANAIRALAGVPIGAAVAFLVVVSLTPPRA